MKIDIEELDLKRYDLEKEKVLAQVRAGILTKVQRRKEVSGWTKQRLYATSRLARLKQKRKLLIDQKTPSSAPEPDLSGPFSQMVLDYFMGNSYTKTKRRSSKEQSSFRRQLIKSYNCEHETDSSLLWCPVLGDWVLNSHMRAAHIVPAAVPDNIVNSVCGQGSAAKLFSTYNGIPMHDNIEKAFDAGHLFIVLVEDSKEDPFDFEVIAVNPDHPIIYERTSKQTLRTGDLHGKRLQFRSDFRPSKRFLYFKYVVMRCRALANNDDDQTEICLDLAKRPPWPTIKSYLAKSSCLKDISTFCGIEYDAKFWQDVQKLQFVDDEPDGPMWSEALGGYEREQMSSSVVSAMDPGLRETEEEEDEWE